MRVQVDAPGNVSRLFSASLTAPGSASSFAPLPTTLFDNVGAKISGGVSTRFASFTFDPYATTPDPNTTGVTRLAFTDSNGSAIEISQLATPVQFTLPAPSVAGGFKSQCRFWDTVTLNYSTAGCVGIPGACWRGRADAA
jgi:hypothetical protein